MAGVTDDLVAFLNARLDEDELLAKRTNSGEWTFDTHGQLLVNQGATISKIANLGVSVFGWHIARHDPARVLREVEAKRAILRMHNRLTPYLESGFTYPAAANFCGYCGPGDNWQAEHEPDHYPGAAWPCQHVRILAAIWSEHPDYQQEWKP